MTEEKKTRSKPKATASEFIEAHDVASQVQMLQAREAEANAFVRKVLRDDFAKAALTGLLAHHGNFNLRSLADAAFQYADFMLEIRDDSAR